MNLKLKILVYHFKRLYHFFKTGLARGLVGQIRYQYPANKIKIIAVTGTDGKTTSSTLLYHILKHAGYKAALISTVAAYLDNQVLETGLHVTSIDPLVLQKLLRKMVDHKIEYLILEVTSHGAYQFRTWGIKPYLGLMTNIAEEHLDYHLDKSLYIKAKALILKKSNKVILNYDDDNFAKLKKELRFKNEKIITYSFQDRLSPQITSVINHRFLTSYNRMNARVVYACCKELKLSGSQIAPAIKTFPGVPGRMEEIPTSKQFRVVVDFAHTTQGIQAVLTALKKQLHSTDNKLIAVYGAAGLRDKIKRPFMGQAGANCADLVVFTAEDPRTENPWSIIRQLKQNLTNDLNKVISIADRKAAISFALKRLAKKGDIVAVLGKGHEKSMCYGTKEIPWSDKKVIQEILQA